MKHVHIIPRITAKDLGMARYFTGTPCKRGHVAERLCSSKVCLDCKKENGRNHYVNNRDKVLERVRKYRSENYEQCRDRDRKYRADNINKERKRALRYNAANRERRAESRRLAYAENRDKELSRNSAYRAENAEKFSAYQSKRRAAKLDRTLSNDEELTDFVMQEASQQTKDMEELFGTPFHVDHMIPMQGENVSGLHVYYNLQVIPAHLNIGKKNRMMYTKPLEWIADAT